MTGLPHDHDSAAVTAREIAALGARQVHDLLSLQLKGDVLPSGRAWMRAAGKFVGSRDLLEHLRSARPLPLQALVCEALRADWFMIAPELALRHVEVQVALRSQLYGGRPKLEKWLRRRVVSGVMDCLFAQTEADMACVAPRNEEQADFAMFEELLGVEPGLARRVMLRVNGMSVGPRRLVFEAIVRGRSVHELAKEVGAEPIAVVKVLDDALQAALDRDASAQDYSAPWMQYADDLMDGEDAG